MTLATWILAAVGAGMVLALLAAAGVLWWRGRKEDARALAGFVPDCIVLVVRLIRDRRVQRRRKLLLVVLIAYLASPFDLLPGSAVDDAIIAALVLGYVLRGNRHLVAEHWPGPPASRDVLLRLAGSRGVSTPPLGRD